MIHRTPSGIESVTVEVMFEWTVRDRWWSPGEEIRRTFREVMWGERRVVMVSELPDDPVWRVYVRPEDRVAVAHDVR